MIPRARPGEPNYDVVDRYTLAHVSVGTVAAWFGFGLVPTVIAAIAFELVEPDILEAWKFEGSTRDTKRNATGDVLATAVGWWIGRALG